MSFSSTIKDEITKLNDDPVCSLISLWTYLKFNSSITNTRITITSENASVTRWLFKTIKSNYNIDVILTMRTIKRFKIRNLYLLEIKDKIEALIIDINQNFSQILSCSHEEKLAFLKGSFLACGSINDPKKNLYHLEFLIKKASDAKLINKILLDLNFKSKILKREREYMIYIKASENISDFIKALGARQALFYFEDIRIYKDHKNMVNRLNNCEQANVEKSLKSSTATLNNIKYLEDNDLITLLDDRLQEIIKYKKQYPDSSLAELAQIISLETGKSITKSGINHHFRKISALVSKHQT